MRATVKEIVSENIVKLDKLWTFHKLKGSRVKIAGLLPGKRNLSRASRRQLEELLRGKEIEITEFLFVSGDVLNAIVHLNGTPVQDNFPERRIPTLEPSRWAEPEESRLMARVFGGLPKVWSNPINALALDSTPFWGNLIYPVKFWERDFERGQRLAQALYSDSHENKVEVDRWFDIFLESPQREAALIVKGDVGLGKSWWVAHKLTNLPKDKYHVILIDLRYKKRGQDLARSLEVSIGEFLGKYITTLNWLYPDFQPLYGDAFDPSDPVLQERMRERALSLSLEELNEKRLRYYGFPDSPELIVAFDNIDHFKESEILTTLDICRRVIGDSGGIKVIVSIRPTTRLPKSRRGLVFGDMIHRTLELKSPDLYQVLARRLSTNHLGHRLDIKDVWPGLPMSLYDVLKTFRDSDRQSGSARLLKNLCCTERVTDYSDMPASKKSQAVTSYDLRFYIKLFRRLIRSDTLGGFENIGNVYYAIHSLLLRGDEPMTEGDAHLFNLFDNEKPDLRGNALIRYRVLEYCDLFHDLGEVFDVYFRALGCGDAAARDVLNLFEDAGLVDVEYVESGDGARTAYRAELSIPGRRHFELVTNLWYIICVKTGMNIYREYILFGEEAKRLASEFVRSEKVLAFYSEHGWVSEDSFMYFIGSQLMLEERRIGEFQARHEEWREQVANMTQFMSDPLENLNYSINDQLAYWRRRR